MGVHNKWLNWVITVDEMHELIDLLNSRCERDPSQVTPESALYTATMFDSLRAAHKRQCDNPVCPIELIDYDAPIPHALTEKADANV